VGRGGRLGGRVGPERADRPPRLHREIHAGEHARASEAALDAFGPDEGVWHYRTTDPDATGSSGRRRTTRSPSAAASSIPWLSTPRSFAGSRFATTTTCRPIRESTA